jgi:hypothetical protein
MNKDPIEMVICEYQKKAAYYAHEARRNYPDDMVTHLQAISAKYAEKAMGLLLAYMDDRKQWENAL